MELNTSSNRLRTHSLDEDENLSNYSRSSYGFYNTTLYSDSECSGQRSVRDMVQLYNNQAKKDDSNTINHQTKQTPIKAVQRQSQNLLASTKSSYCGLNNYNSQTNVKQFVDQMEDKSLINDQNLKVATTCCKNCAACVFCQNRSRRNSTANIKKTTTAVLSPLLNNENNNCNQSNAKDILVVEKMDPTTSINKQQKQQKQHNQTILNGGGGCGTIDAEFKDNLNKNQNSQVVVQKNHQQQNHHLQRNHHHRLLTTDSVEEANICQPIETSYQSKTTIAKTSSGVRIIIDIFFDQEQSAAAINATDATVGSRVETDIPQSRILNEFQQQAHAIGGSNGVDVAAAGVGCL